ncbi:hypothetical protein BRADI_3g19507v3, partial [Brachypodium distachyon]
MRRRTAAVRWVPRRRRAGGGVDRLSALPDALLHLIMSSLKAWEVVRTCVLSRRWRDLWASAPCVDIRVFYSGRDGAPPRELRGFVYRLFLLRDPSAPVHTLRLQSNDEDDSFCDGDADTWIKTAIKSNARVIRLDGRRGDFASLDHTAFVFSSHLKILKLSYVLDLKDCLVTGHEFSSASLKALTMSKCKIVVDFSIDAPNLVLLRLIIPYIRIPTFKNLGSLVTGTIVLVDSCLGDDFQGLSDADHSGETDDVDDDSDTSENYNMGYGHAYIGDYSYGTNGTYKYSEIISDCDDEKYGYHGDGHNCSKDGNYCDYGATANYGRNESKSLDVNSVLQSLRNARTLELLSYSGEVLLNRDFKSCPTFSNLKTMSLGEWCIAADFDALVLLLQHSPNLERLFLELILNLNIRKALERGLKLKERSFACKHLRMVEIKCSKDDVRVHMLAELFKANGIPHEKLYVHWP